jgi:hypothetical protein
MTDEDTHELGPLAALQGVWEGSQGADVSPDDDRTEIERNAFRERLEFEPTGLVENHEQSLYGLRYFRVAWRLGAEDPFHEQVGYWLWDAEAKQVMLSFVVPRGICVLAGGPAEPDAKSFRLEAEEGSDVFGISSGPFLNEQFKTVRYHIDVTFDEDGSFSYAEDTVMRIKGLSDLFHHTDRNTLRRVT